MSTLSRLVLTLGLLGTLVLLASVAIPKGFDSSSAVNQVVVADPYGTLTTDDETLEPVQDSSLSSDPTHTITEIDDPSHKEPLVVTEDKVKPSKATINRTALRAEDLAEVHLKRDKQAEKCLNWDLPKDSAELSSHGAALQAVEELQAFGVTMPVIVGGVGDSGTRGLYSLLEEYGVYMGSGKEAVKVETKDSKLFSGAMNLTMEDGSIKAYQVSTCVNPPLKAARSVFYCRETLENDEKWYLAVQFTALMFTREYDYYLNHGKKKKYSADKKLITHGFKHPRTVLFLPFFATVLKRNFRFILVIRDGREVATGNNKRFYRDVCSLYYGSRVLCYPTKRNQLRFWAELNLEVIQWFKLTDRMEQLLVVRAEDLVSGEEHCLQRIADFVGASSKAYSKIGRLASKYRKYEPSYNGNKLTEEDKIMLTEYAHQVPQALTALDLFGYQRNSSMGVDKPCEHLNHL